MVPEETDDSSSMYTHIKCSSTKSFSSRYQVQDAEEEVPSRRAVSPNPLCLPCFGRVCAFVHKYLEAIVEGIRNADDSVAAAAADQSHDETTATMFQTIIFTSIDPQHINTYLTHCQRDDFKARSQVNCMSALIRHLTFLKRQQPFDIVSRRVIASSNNKSIIYQMKLNNK